MKFFFKFIFAKLMGQGGGRGPHFGSKKKECLRPVSGKTSMTNFLKIIFAKLMGYDKFF